jgi:NAD(P)-dependent dehydrogenase (short-subunit alcohol dehydrogenase family)
VRAAGEGARIVLTYRDDADAAQRVVDAIADAGGQAVAIRADAANEHETIAVFEEAARLGVITGVVINAGITGGFHRVDELESSVLRDVFAINVLGAFECAREAVRRMSTKHGGQGGAIVTISSRAARLGSPGEYVHYAASKAAVETMTIGLAREVAREGIRVNAVAPGVIATDIHARGGDAGRLERKAATTPMGRVGQADEVAEAVVWLLSDAASYVTAAILDVAGGR